MSLQLPPEYETPYEIAANNAELEKGIRYYVEEIARKNGCFQGKSDEKSLLVTSITKILRLLPAYGYYAAHIIEVEKLPGLVTQARFIVEDRNHEDKTAIRAEITLVSEDYSDYEKFILQRVLPSHHDSADLR